MAVALFAGACVLLATCIQLGMLPSLETTELSDEGWYLQSRALWTPHSVSLGGAGGTGSLNLQGSHALHITGPNGTTLVLSYTEGSARFQMVDAIGESKTSVAFFADGLFVGQDVPASLPTPGLHIVPGEGGEAITVQSQSTGAPLARMVVTPQSDLLVQTGVPLVTRLRVAASGQVGVNVPDEQPQLHAMAEVAGDVLARSFRQVSDARLKDVQGLIDGDAAWRCLQSLDAIEYLPLNASGSVLDEEPHLGLVAQQLQACLPAAVNSHGEFLDVDYVQVLAALVAAMQSMAADCPV